MKMNTSKTPIDQLNYRRFPSRDHFDDEENHNTPRTTRYESVHHSPGNSNAVSRLADRCLYVFEVNKGKSCYEMYLRSSIKCKEAKDEYKCPQTYKRH